MTHIEHVVPALEPVLNRPSDGEGCTVAAITLTPQMPGKSLTTCRCSAAMTSTEIMWECWQTRCGRVNSLRVARSTSGPVMPPASRWSTVITSCMPPSSPAGPTLGV